MEKRFLTFFVLTNDATKTRSMKLPLKLIKIGGAVSAFLFLALAFIVVDYARVKMNSAELYRLRKENAAQKIELQGILAKVRGLEDDLSKLSLFDKKLRIIANLERPGALSGKGGPLSPGQGGLMGLGGDSSATEGVFTTTSTAVGELSKRMDNELNSLEEKAMEQEKSFNELHEQLLKKTSFLASTPSIWPLHGWVTSGFDQRISPFTGLPQFHRGLDIANRPGSQVLSPGDGVVIKSLWDNGLGKTITIRHGYGITTTYGHLSEFYVRVGQKVKRGQKIAAVGNTGRSTGPHLHYEVAVNGVPVNPYKYILE